MMNLGEVGMTVMCESAHDTMDKCATRVTQGEKNRTDDHGYTQFNLCKANCLHLLLLLLLTVLPLALIFVIVRHMTRKYEQREVCLQVNVHRTMLTSSSIAEWPTKLST